MIDVLIDLDVLFMSRLTFIFRIAKMSQSLHSFKIPAMSRGKYVNIQHCFNSNKPELKFVS